MKFLLGLLLIAINSTAFAAGCVEETKALAMIDAIKRYEANVSYSVDDIAKAEQWIRNDEFCVGGLSERIHQMMLCTAMAVDVGLAPGQENRVKAKDPRNQADLERALLDYGKLFPAEGETQGFTCDLKKMRFPALD